MTARVRAAGAVVWRPGSAGAEVAVVHRPRYDDWSLPKGKARPGEPPPATARREVAEETGVTAALGRWLGCAQYRVEEYAGATEKRVDYWAARAGGAARLPPGDEVDEVAWLPVDAAYERLSWASDRGVLARFEPVRTSTVLLVRHATAGSAAGWAGADADRPLDAGGLLQSLALAGSLPAYWLPDEAPRVFAAPLARCVDTVRWAGVTTDARLGQEAGDPAAAAALVGELAAYGVAVACSQGGVIPAVVHALRRAAGLPSGGARAAKGSTWVLSFAAGRLVAADHLDAP